MVFLVTLEHLAISWDQAQDCWVSGWDMSPSSSLPALVYCLSYLTGLSVSGLENAFGGLVILRWLTHLCVIVRLNRLDWKLHRVVVGVRGLRGDLVYTNHKIQTLAVETGAIRKSFKLLLILMRLVGPEYTSLLYGVVTGSLFNIFTY